MCFNNRVLEKFQKILMGIHWIIYKLLRAWKQFITLMKNLTRDVQLEWNEKKKNSKFRWWRSLKSYISWWKCVWNFIEKHSFLRFVQKSESSWEFKYYGVRLFKAVLKVSQNSSTLVYNSSWFLQKSSRLFNSPLDLWKAIAGLIRRFKTLQALFENY